MEYSFGIGTQKTFNSCTGSPYGHECNATSACSSSKPRRLDQREMPMDQHDGVGMPWGENGCTACPCEGYNVTDKEWKAATINWNQLCSLLCRHINSSNAGMGFIVFYCFASCDADKAFDPPLFQSPQKQSKSRVFVSKISGHIVGKCKVLSTDQF